MGLFANDGDRVRCDVAKYRGMLIPCSENKPQKGCPGCLRLPKKGGWKPIAKSDAERVRKDWMKYPGLQLCERKNEGGSCPTEKVTAKACFNKIPKGGLEAGKFVQHGLEAFRYM